MYVLVYYYYYYYYYYLLLLLLLLLFVVSGLNEFHKRGYLHNDLKAENIIVCLPSNNDTEYPLLKFIDFGLSDKEEIISNKTTYDGTLEYSVC
jgi:serine/threonine protein kinase